ncbi:MAG: SPOR domain-containing protein [Proteobacteria bacterium]|nr:SPOR domain-containing protein [Pseudomonadota bacterium]
MAGAFQVQLASARSEQGAMGEWNRIAGKNKEALAGLTPSVARVDLGEKGVFFRLRAGPLKDKAAADSVCAALGAQNVGCIVVKP